MKNFPSFSQIELTQVMQLFHSVEQSIRIYFFFLSGLAEMNSLFFASKKKSRFNSLRTHTNMHAYVRFAMRLVGMPQAPLVSWKGTVFVQLCARAGLS